MTRNVPVEWVWTHWGGVGVRYGGTRDAASRYAWIPIPGIFDDAWKEIKLNRGKSLTAAAAIASLLALTSCGSPSHQAGTNTPTGSSGTPSPALTTQTHNAEDVTFAQSMIPHHQQAIKMSDVVLSKQGIDARVTDLATRIKDAQGPEVREMQNWLLQWGQPPTPSTPSGHGGMPGMDGMMSDQDIQSLQNAQGTEAGRLYLTQMVRHHQGAIVMAQNEIKSGQFVPAIALARSIVATQQQEIDTMQAIVSSL